MADLRGLLEKLSNEFGVSGRERTVRALVRSEIEGLVDRVEVDALGNLIAYKAGDGPEPRLRVMLSAHMDEVGFIITKIEKNGLLRFHQVGGPEVRTLLAKRLVIGDDRIAGVIGAPPIHLQSVDQRNKIIGIDHLTIDIGATSDKDANSHVKVGDYATFATRFTVLSDDPAWPTVRGKAFDDRAGCTALIGILAERYPVDVVGVFSVQEEVGLRGARVAAFRTEPDAAIALEGTICDDLPKPPDEEATPVTRLGDGPAVTLMDRSVVSHPGLLRLLRETAEAENIAIQYKAPGLGGTDAGAIHLARVGVPSIVAAIPCRYIHGPAAILNLNDLTNTVGLVSAALRRIDRSYVEREA
jgi:putative aminopeptidase FrvX